MLRLEVFAIEGFPEVVDGDDVAALLLGCEPGLRNGDVVVVTSKIVSKAEGRLAPGTRDDHLAAESVRVVASRGPMHIVETHHGFVMAAAGIDESNVPAGQVALLPLDPDASARRIREAVAAGAGVDVAVMVSDTMGRPWRDGVVDTAIGAAGIDAVADLRGQRDATGHLLEATVVAVADELAAAADLVKGKLSNSPVAVIRGFAWQPVDAGADRGAARLVRSAADDLFRLGTSEAMAEVVANSAPLDRVAVTGDVTVDVTVDVDEEAVRRAIDAVTTAGVALEVRDRGHVVLAVADNPFLAGIALGRLLTALAAEGLRAALAPDGSPALHLTDTVE